MDDRITIRMTESQAERLEVLATRYQLSAAEVVRKALERVTDADLARSVSQADGMPEESDGVQAPPLWCRQPGSAPVRTSAGITYAQVLQRIAARMAHQARPQAPAAGEPDPPEGSSPAHERGA